MVIRNEGNTRCSKKQAKEKAENPKYEKMGERRAQWRTILRSGMKGLENLVYPENLYCISCGHPIDRGMPYSLCGNCREKMDFATESHKETGYHATWYRLSEREMVHRFKYGNCAYYAAPMAKMMADMLRMAEAGEDGVLPESLPDFYDGIAAVPLHEEKFRARGYNQAELLARALGEEIAVPYLADVLIRTRKTVPLKDLGPAERKLELEGVFAAGRNRKVAGKRLLLVDDILTSGATSEACRNVLLEMGAETVKIVTFTATKTKSLSKEIPYYEDRDGSEGPDT